MAYSANLTPFSGDSGTVVTIGFITEPVYGDFTIEFVNPILGNPQSQNVLTGSQNGTITLDSPVPLLSPFTPIEFLEDDNYVIYRDTLLAHVSDEDTPLDKISFTFSATYLTISAQGEDYLITPQMEWSGTDTIVVTASDGYYYDHRRRNYNYNHQRLI